MNNFAVFPKAAAQASESEGALEEMTVTQLKELLDSDADDYVLIDVRNPNEYQIAKIPNATLIPLPDIEDGDGVAKVKELVGDKRLIAHCKLGGRSAKALNILKEAGIEGINVKGGIAAWSEEVDSSVPQY